MAGSSLLGQGRPNPSLTCTDRSESFARSLVHIATREGKSSWQPLNSSSPSAQRYGCAPPTSTLKLSKVTSLDLVYVVASHSNEKPAVCAGQPEQGGDALVK